VCRLVEECFEELELDGYVQLAHFHPDYTVRGDTKQAAWHTIG
jgi:hypothetical protein